MGKGEGTAGWITVCSLRSVSLTFLRPAYMYCLFRGAGGVGGEEKLGCQEEDEGSK